ncbi:hypothetical protein TSAR_006473 [Trichomalopsis sarcophagae]|uniref:Uncharacterized protein n=1 Tax=Trichomalopsis sarcophagae TaxID=543379 RepID=A0A232FB12_9HYME|nr:hypothetical protein TSAR_006473 [Trichomalopsis sarcophagae]
MSLIGLVIIDDFRNFEDETDSTSVYLCPGIEMLTNGKLLAKVMVSAGSLANHNQLLAYFLPGWRANL